MKSVNMIKHYKDKKEIQYQCKHLDSTMEKEKCFIKELAEKCREAYENEVLNTDALSKLLIDPKAAIGDPLTPDHIRCNGFKDSPRSGGEKQICHCMFYYNSQFPKRCTDGCDLKPWKNVGGISVDEFEYPSKFYVPQIGGIDLVLNYKGTVYGAEVKPPGSDETVSRMVSEILTYYVVDKAIDFCPAIAVFKDSKQYDVVVKLEKELDDDWAEIRKIVSVFVICYKEKADVKEFIIRPFEDKDKESCKQIE